MAQDKYGQVIPECPTCHRPLEMKAPSVSRGYGWCEHCDVWKKP